MSKFRLTLNGKAPAIGRFFKVRNPATGETVGECPHTTSEQVAAACSGARDAFLSWKTRTLRDRGRILEGMARVVADESEAVSELICAENGKTLRDARGEVQRAVASLELTVQYFRDIKNEILNLDDTNYCLLRRIPIGVFGLIIPFNFPIHTLFQKLAPALLAGNSCVIRPSSETPLSSLYLIEKIYEKMDLPKGLIQTVTGDEGRDLVENEFVNGISFTGSTETGNLIAEKAAKTLKRVRLELGGNCPAVILDDCGDIKVLARKLASAAFTLSGQVCHALKRVYVHESIYDDLVTNLILVSDRYSVGDPRDEKTDIGPVTTGEQFERAKRLFSSSDYSVLCGGVLDSQGYFVRPGIVVGKDENGFPNSELVREEQFCPILPVIRFSDKKEVLREINSDAKGLTASVWGTQINECRELAEQIEAGTVYVNQHSSSHSSTSSLLYPAQGHKMSGYGSTRGLLGFHEYQQPQTVNIRNSI